MSGIETQLRKKYPSANFHIEESSDVIHMMHIAIPSKSRRLGVGTSIMSDVGRYADKECKTVALNPDENYGTPLKVLERFYGKQGFEKNKSSKYEWADMIRKPRCKRK